MSVSPIEFWVVVQMALEMLLGGLILYHLYCERKERKGLREERARIKVVMDSLHRITTKSSDLEKRHQRLLDLWETVQEHGERMEGRIGDYAKGLTALAEKPQPESDGDCYERASRLIERGMSIEEITRTVGLPQGEIALIMNLKRP